MLLAIHCISMDKKVRSLSAGGWQCSSLSALFRLRLIDEAHAPIRKSSSADPIPRPRDSGSHGISHLCVTFPFTCSPFPLSSGPQSSHHRRQLTPQPRPCISPFFAFVARHKTPPPPIHICSIHTPYPQHSSIPRLPLLQSSKLCHLCPGKGQLPSERAPHPRSLYNKLLPQHLKHKSLQGRRTTSQKYLANDWSHESLLFARIRFTIQDSHSRKLPPNEGTLWDLLGILWIPTRLTCHKTRMLHVKVCRNPFARYWQSHNLRGLSATYGS